MSKRMLFETEIKSFFQCYSCRFFFEKENLVINERFPLKKICKNCAGIKDK